MEKPHPADAVRAEIQACILILNPSAQETDFLAALCRAFGEVRTAARPEGVETALRGARATVLVADAGLARLASLVGEAMSA